MLNSLFSCQALDRFGSCKYLNCFRMGAFQNCRAVRLVSQAVEKRSEGG